jgi:predicted aminopeptidase
MGRVFALALLQIMLSSCYTVNQAIHFNSLYNSRLRVEEAIASAELPAKIRRRLELVQRILRYAHSQQLNSEGAYRYYIHTSRPAVSFLVQAAYADRLERLTWWFPFVGEVPYLGYFDRQDRDAKARDLRESGFDVAVGSVGAFSSLGWFEDPLYTSMLLRRDSELAHLLFHELVHRTLWISGSVEFNENLAEFGASVITRKYLQDIGEATEWDRYMARRADRQRYRQWVKALRHDLEDLYEQSIDDRQQLMAAKEALFARYVQEKLPEFATAAYDFVQRRNWNNAYILGASLYLPDIEEFQRAYQCIGEPVFGQFLVQLEKRVDQFDDPFTALNSMCS